MARTKGSNRDSLKRAAQARKRDATKRRERIQGSHPKKDGPSYKIKPGYKTSRGRIS